MIINKIVIISIEVNVLIFTFFDHDYQNKNSKRKAMDENMKDIHDNTKLKKKIEEFNVFFVEILQIYSKEKKKTGEHKKGVQ